MLQNYQIDRFLELFNETLIFLNKELEFFFFLQIQRFFDRRFFSVDPRRGLPTSRTRPTFIKQKLETNLQRNDDQEKQVKLSNLVHSIAD